MIRAVNILISLPASLAGVNPEITNAWAWCPMIPVMH